MHQFVICKYDPQFRDSSGRYLRDEWTCPSEIGKTFEGREFTRNEYLEVEHAHISSVMHFFRATGLPRLRVCNLVVDMQAMSPGKSRAIPQNTPDWMYDPLRELVLAEDQIIQPEQIPAILMMNLRPETSGCTLEFAGKFYVDFSYDYYLYVGTASDPAASLEQVKKQSLFSHSMDTPNWRSNPRYAISASKHESEFVDSESEEFELSPTQFREVFGLSAEHPGINKGTLSIRPTHASELRKYVDIEFDFARNSYTLENQS